MDPLNNPPESLGFGYMPEMNAAPDVLSPVDRAQERQAREAKTSKTDYAGSMFRQDSLIDGAMASLAAHNTLPPDPAYSAFSDPSMDEVTKDVWPEFQKELFKAHSPAHRDFIADRLRQKQTDLVRLGDLGFAGNVGRIALGVVSPDQLLMGMAGGWVARGAKAFQIATAAKAGMGALASAEARAGVRAAQAASASSVKAVGLGVGFGAAENVAYEKMRQSVNFEDDSGMLIEAGLIGSALTLPFAIMGARSAARASDVVNMEHAVLTALKTVHEGGEITPAQGRLIDQTARTHEAIRQFEAGKIDEVDLEKALDGFHGPQEPDSMWMSRFSDRIRADAQKIIDDLYEPQAPQAPKAPEAPPVVRDPNAIDGPTRVGPAEAPPTALELAFKRAEQRNKKRAQDNEAKRKQSDLEAGFDSAKEIDTKTRNALLGEAFARAEAHASAEKSKQLEAMIRQRELARMVADDEPFVSTHDEATKVPEQAPEGQPKAPPPEAPVEAPKQTAESFIGTEVSWTGRDGDHVYGKGQSVNEFGRLTVLGEDGKLHHIKPENLTQWAPDVPPSGWLHGSVGAGTKTVIESTASGRTELTTLTLPVKWKGKNIEVPLRFDRYAAINASKVKKIRELGYRLLKDPLQNDKFDAQAMTASEHKKEIHRRLGGRFHMEAAQALDAAMQASGISMVNLKARSEFTTSFYAYVTRATRGDASVAVEAKDINVHVQKAASAMREAYKQYLKEAKDAGVKGADQVADNDFYANRIWHHGNIREMQVLHGDDAPIDVIAASIKDRAGIIERYKKSPAYKADPNVSDADIVRMKAKRFFNAVRALEFSPAIQDAVLGGRDMHTLRQHLADMKVADDQIDDLVDLLFEVKHGDKSDTGNTARLKYRFALDESAKIQTSAGELRLSDLFENDSRVLMDTYGGSMAGHIGLAKHDITSATDWAKEIAEARKEAMADATNDGHTIEKEIGLLEDAYRNITGRPMSNNDAFSNTARMAGAFRGYTRAVMLPQLGIAAAFETGKAVAMFGFRNMLRHGPTLRNFISTIRKGYIPDAGFARDVQLFTGFGYEMKASYARDTELEMGWAGRGLTRFEQFANTASHTVDRLSGNASFTSMTKHWSAMGAIQNMADFAHGRRKMTSKMQERWVGQGISVDDHAAVMDDLKTFSVEKDGVIQSLDYEGWQQTNQATYDKFKTFVNRQVRDAIQDHDFGETMPFMDSTLGKMFTELKTFFLVGHAKNFLKNLMYRDMTSLHIWGIGFLAESLAYITQSAINAPGDLENRLQPDRIATAAFFRMSSLGTASLLTETGYGLMTGGDSLVQPGMTANTDNRSFLNTPSLMVAKKLFNAPMTIGGMALQTDTMTRGEMRDLWGSLPGLRLYGLKAVGEYLAETRPSYDPEKTRTGP